MQLPYNNDYHASSMQSTMIVPAARLRSVSPGCLPCCGLISAARNLAVGVQIMGLLADVLAARHIWNQPTGRALR
mgnify:CR=1 FL=1